MAGQQLGQQPNQNAQAAQQANTQQMELGWFLNLMRNIATQGMGPPRTSPNGIPMPPEGSPAMNFLAMMQQQGQQNPKPQSGMEGSTEKGNPAGQPRGAGQQKPKNSAAQNTGAGKEGDGAANNFLKALASLFGGGG